MTLDERLTNWGECMRLRRQVARLASAEGAWRGQWARAWQWTDELGWIPNVRTYRPPLDMADARVVDLAWQAMDDRFHQFLLAAWYVRQWSEAKCLWEARQFAGDKPRRTERNITPCLTMARLLLSHQLTLPAVVHRPRIVARIRAALDLDQPQPVDRIHADAL